MRTLILVFSSLTLLWGVTPGCNSVSGSGRKQVNFYSAADDARIGEQAWAEVLSDPSVLRDGPDVQRVNRVGDRIVESALRLHPQVAKDFDWEFAVIDDPGQINAFALPGGKFAVYTGMLAFTGQRRWKRGDWCMQ